MFYSEVILSRRGPLARVWLAAHYERKLSKTQTLQTDITESVDAIMGQDVAPMALRLSGQLLLGVVRIYSRKTKYLLDDCNEALLKIKMAFRPGIVDMTEEQLSVPQNAITLQGEGIDLDLLLPDLNWDIDFARPATTKTRNIARVGDITLPENFAPPSSDAGDDPILGSINGIGSQDFLDDDLGVNFDILGVPGGVEDESIDVERPRDAENLRSARQSLEATSQFGNDRDLDIFSELDGDQPIFGGDEPFGDDMGLENIISFEIPGIDPIDDREKTPGQVRDDSRASSPLTAPPATPPPLIEDAPTPKAAKRQIAKRQIIDEVTELEGGPGARYGGQAQADLSEILGEQHFLPRSRTVMRLLEIRADPVAHFMPTRVTNEGTFFCAAPPGLVPELAEMFMFPTTSGRRLRDEASPDRERTPKRARTGTAEPDVEYPRRQPSQVRSIPGTDPGRMSFGHEGDITAGDFGGYEDDQPFQGMDLDPPPEMGDLGGDIRTSERGTPRPRATAMSRVSTPGFDMEDVMRPFDDIDHPLRIFDTRSQAQSESSAQQTQEDAGDGESVEGGHQQRGFSKNTLKAIGILRKELQPGPGESDKVMSFNKLADKASRRAASSFFFEILFLGTRDHVQPIQSGPFENIEVRAKEKLWAQAPIQLTSTAPSVAT